MRIYVLHSECVGAWKIVLTLQNLKQLMQARNISETNFGRDTKITHRLREKKYSHNSYSTDFPQNNAAGADAMNY